MSYESFINYRYEPEGDDDSTDDEYDPEEYLEEIISEGGLDDGDGDTEKP